MSESNRSNIPPCPGIIDDESFTLTSRLSMLSIKSPACPKVPIIIPITTVSTNERKSKTIKRAAIIPTTEKIKPAIAPSQLFCGLILGRILCVPIAEPTKYAAESQIQIAAKIDMIK